MRDIDDIFNENNMNNDINNSADNSADNFVSFGESVSSFDDSISEATASVVNEEKVEDIVNEAVANSESVVKEEACTVENTTINSSIYNQPSEPVYQTGSQNLNDSVYSQDNQSAYFSGQYSSQNINNGTDEYQRLRDKVDKKEAKKMAKADKKASKTDKKANKDRKGTKILLKVGAFVLCAVMLGIISAGAFIGTIHLTGYDDKLDAVLDAADNQESAVHVNTVTPSGTTSNNTEGAVSISSIVEDVMPSIVSITSTIVYESQGFGFFFGGGSYETSGAGSGIIIGQNASELLIVTNYHVIEDATSLVVSFDDGTDINATVKGVSEDNDLAVIAVSLSEVEDSTLNAISIATFGDSDNLKMGDRVIAIGNALGYGQSVTVGYISALSREVTIDNNTMTLLQTDAAINPGNSGGALINESGELIGINSAKYSDTNVEGMGFAIPISSVKELIEELMNKEPKVEVEESQIGYLGITPADVDSSSAYLYNMPEGVYVYSLTVDGPAAKSGIMEKDIITKLDGEKITSSSELQEILRYYAGGTTVDVTIQRVVDGQYQEFVIPVELGFKAEYETESNRPAIGFN